MAFSWTCGLSFHSQFPYDLLSSSTSPMLRLFLLIFCSSFIGCLVRWDLPGFAWDLVQEFIREILCVRTASYGRSPQPTSLFSATIFELNNLLQTNFSNLIPKSIIMQHYINAAPLLVNTFTESFLETNKTALKAMASPQLQLAV